jgi:hypothetical protein
LFFLQNLNFPTEFFFHVGDFLIQVVNRLTAFICMFESILRYLIILVIEKLWTFQGVRLPRFLLFLVFCVVICTRVD